MKVFFSSFNRNQHTSTCARYYIKRVLKDIISNRFHRYFADFMHKIARVLTQLSNAHAQRLLKFDS